MISALEFCDQEIGKSSILSLSDFLKNTRPKSRVSWL